MVRKQPTLPLLDRFSANAAGRQSKQAYVASLLRWGILRSWNPRARTALDWADEAEHRSKPLSKRKPRSCITDHPVPARELHPS